MQYFEACLRVVVVNLIFGGFYAFSDLDKELVDVAAVELSCLFIEGVCDFVLFDVQKGHSKILHNVKDQMIAPIVPVLSKLLSEIQLACFGTHKWVVDLTDEKDSRSKARKVFEGHLEL